MAVLPSLGRHLDPDCGDDYVDNEQRHEREDDRLVDGVAHRLWAATGYRQSPITRNQAGDQAEQGRLDPRDDQLWDSGEHRDAGGERTGVDLLDKHREDVAAQNADYADKAVQ